MLDLARSILAVSLISLAAYGCGRPLVRLLRLDDSDRLSAAVWSLALGLVASGTVLLGLGLAGLMHEVVVLCLTLAGVVLAAIEVACTIAGLDPAVAGQRWTLGRRLRAWRNEITLPRCLMGVILGVGLVGALAPPLQADVLMRSLAVPKAVLLERGILLADPEASLPNLSQLWSLWALALDGPVAANLLHWVLGVLLGLATVLLGRPLLGAKLAAVAGAAVLLTPAVQQDLGVPLESIPLALLATLALAAMGEALLNFDRGHWAGVAGIMAGAATATHTAGLLLTVAIVSTGLYQVWIRRDADTHLWRSPWQASLSAAAVALPWLLGGIDAAPAEAGAASLVALGPVLAIGCGGLLFARRLRGLPWLLGILLAYVGLSMIFVVDAGGWAVLVPVGAVATAWTWHEISRLTAGPRWGVRALVAVAVLVDLARHGQTAAPGLPVAVGWQSRQQYLLQHEGSYRAAAVLNSLNSQRLPLVTEDSSAFYFSCPTYVIKRAENEASAGPREPAVLAQGRVAGASYVLMAEAVEPDSDASGAPSASGHLPATSDGDFENLYPGGEVIPILEYRFADDNNRCIRYRLWKLHSSQADSGGTSLGKALSERRVGRLPQPPTR